MICKSCEEKGHYWFSPDWDGNEGGMDAKTTKKVGIYGSCDMRQVYDTGVGCQCGCHKGNRPMSKVIKALPFNSGMLTYRKAKKGTFAKKKVTRAVSAVRTCKAKKKSCKRK